MVWALAALLFVSAWLTARNRFKRADEAVLAACLLAFSEIIIFTTLLGWLGVLKPVPVIALTALLGAAHTIYSFRRRRPLRSFPSWRRVALFAPWPLWPAIIFAAAVLAFRLALAAALPFDSWDGMSYHLPILLRWLQQGSFDLTGWLGPARYFPWNGELLSAWITLLDGAHMEPAKITQALSMPLWTAAGAVLGRRLAGARWALPAALALVSLPIALIHAGITYVDLVYSAFWLAAASAALCLERTRHPAYLLLFAAAFGLAAGTKSTLYFQLPLLIAPLWTLLEDDKLLGRALRLAPLLLALTALTGATSYLHNWWTTGDPIYPYSFKLGVVTIFRGIMAPGELLVSVERWFVPSSAGWLWYPFHETMRGAIGYSTENGFGPLFAAGWVFWLYAFRLAWKNRDRGAFGFLLLLPATAFFFLTLHPTREQRYVIFFSAVPILALAYVFRKISGGLRLLTAAAWTFGLSFGLCGVLSYVGRDADMVKAWRGLKEGNRPDPFVYYRAKFGPLGDGWAVLNGRLSSGDVVATNYGELILPWAGLPERAKVLVVTHKRTAYPGTLYAEDDAGWMALLDRLNVKYFALWTPAWYPEEGRPERESIAKFPGRFALMGKWQSGDIGQVELYELVPAAAAPAAPPHGENR